MPIYEYQCQSCQHELEALQKMSDPVLTDCPECKQASLVKKISAAGFRLKGGGWYETDFKTGSKKKNIAGDSGSGSSSGGGSSSGSSSTES
ncbi:MAG: FmdB family zinc ribbon protein [Spongiibacteraceae bacterium]